MSTPQNTQITAPNQSAYERTAPLFTVNLSISLGVNSLSVYHALDTLRDELYELSIEYLVDKNLDAHLNVVDEIEGINDMMLNLFTSVNDACQQFVDNQRTADVHESVAKRRIEAKAKLRTLFDFSK